MARSYYEASVADFLRTSQEAVFGALSARHGHALDEPQRYAWQFEINHLATALRAAPDGHVFFEFEIPRIGRRTDVILIVRGIIFVIEYKVGASHYDLQSVDQVTDYALDLKCFHSGSHNAPIVPVLVATEGCEAIPKVEFGRDQIATTLCANRGNLADIIVSTVADTEASPLDGTAWVSSPYCPTPTIIQAAQALYRGHQVSAISRSDAGAVNLTRTTDCVSGIIEDARRTGHKAICLVTGVPGAGKTLAGLNIATERLKADSDSHAVFLSGNDPLVAVLREALAIDEVEQSRIRGVRLRKNDARRKTSAFIQNIRHFRDDSLGSDTPPIEKVVVFDEAQRAWNQEQLSSFMRRKRGRHSFEDSEPEFLLSVMDRHTDWCCVVCLIGGGQEINTGEAGILEWLSALENRFSHWRVYCSGEIQSSEYDWNGDLASKLKHLGATALPDLHLRVSLRSFRAENVSAFISALVFGDALEARGLFETIPNYPIVVTRNLQEGKAWLRQQARGSERIGMLASSNAVRLKPEGVYVKQDIDPAVWFLNGKEDVRSSYYLEDVATEFHVQGLELDWALVCWDANFRRVNDQWRPYNFSGTRWQSVNGEERRRYVANSYRVLLTRARQGLAIYVPHGEMRDATRPPSHYDGIFHFLLQCGIREI